MKKLLTLLLAIITLPVIAAVRQTINSGWTFRLEKDSTWQRVSLPHTWNNDDQDDIPGYYRGKGIYRKKLYVDENARGKRVFLYFDGANQTTTVYINGKQAGEHQGGYTRFAVDITPYINVGEDNELLVHVDNRHNKMIPPLSADFTFFGGIYRSVHLVIEEPVHLSISDKASNGVYVRTPKVCDTEADVEVECLLNNYLEKKQKVNVTVTIIAPDGTKTQEMKRKVSLNANTRNAAQLFSLKIKEPKLWSTENPQLYKVHTIITNANDEVLDKSEEVFGLRWYEFDADKGFSLNGKPMKLIGANRHQDFLGKGWAIDESYHIQDIKLLKEMGANFIRIAHYPQDPAILEACDRMGIMASVEIPIVNTVTESDEFLQNCLFMQEEMVKQNFNHPAVIIWTYMNEVLLVPPYRAGTPKYQPYLNEVHRQAQAIENLTRRLDPYRYTMIPFNNNRPPYEDAKLFDIPMIIGWNVYFGWYSGRFNDLEKFLDEYHAAHPDKPTIISEYGADSDIRIHSDSPSRFDYSVEYGDLFHEYYLDKIKNEDYIAGGAIWVLNSFSSEGRSNAKPHVNLKGVVTQNRMPKNTYWHYKAHFSQEPFVKIASADWTHRSGLLNNEHVFNQEVKVYSNQPKVTVMLNGKSLGSYNVNNGFAKVTIPFVDGKNNLVATANGYSDATTITFNGLPQKLNENFTEMNILLGSTRSFTDPESGICWIPEKAYEPGSWGYIGGEPNFVRNWAGTLPASDVSILTTELDPLYQTQRKKLNGFRADIPAGRYAVTLIWADLTQERYEKFANNLGNDVIHEDSDDSFSVKVNNMTIYENLDIRKAVGRQTPLHTTVDVIVTADNPCINIELQPIKGNTLLNAVRIVKKH